MTSVTTFLLCIVVAGLATAVIWVSSGWLETSSEHIAEYLALPEVVKGAVITAVASSFPELSSVVIATLLHGEFALGLASIVGSAVFNILVIPAVAVLSSSTMKADWSVVYKEALFYLIAISVLLLTLCFAVIYFPVPEQSLKGSMTRGLAFIPIAVYGIYLFIQYQDAKDHRAVTAAVPKKGGIWKQWLIVLGSMLLIAAAVEALIWSSMQLGELFGTPAFLWGLTIIAAGTSLPDMFISIKAARKGESSSSLANVFGSNTFDLLICVPVGVLIAGATVIDLAQGAPMMASLTAVTLAMFVLLRLGLDLTRRDAIILLLLYFLFVGWIVLETAGYSSILSMSAG